jgi:acyl-CoA dehydrogenase
MFIVPTRTPGVEIVHNVKVMGDDHAGDGGMHAHIRYNPVRVPHDAMLGLPREGFKARLGGGRVHHAMMTIGKRQRAST